jgi:hypothetical protein
MADEQHRAEPAVSGRESAAGWPVLIPVRINAITAALPRRAKFLACRGVTLRLGLPQ